MILSYYKQNENVKNLLKHIHRDNIIKKFVLNTKQERDYQIIKK